MTVRSLPPQVVYPDSDGKPMAENTKQYEWIVTIKGNLDAVFRDDPAVFVAGDNLIYPVEGSIKIRQAPDVYVAFGRPKGHRGSYQVFAEANIFPQVVFEVLSPGNRAGEMKKKLEFYERYGAEEYYVYDPDRVRLVGYRRGAGARFEAVPDVSGYISPRLGVRFEMGGPELVIYRPDGQRFLTFAEVSERADRADAETARADRLAAKLRALGVDPDGV